MSRVRIEKFQYRCFFSGSYSLLSPRRYTWRVFDERKIIISSPEFFFLGLRVRNNCNDFRKRKRKKKKFDSFFEGGKKTLVNFIDHFISLPPIQSNLHRNPPPAAPETLLIAPFGKKKREHEYNNHERINS